MNFCSIEMWVWHLIFDFSTPCHHWQYDYVSLEKGKNIEKVSFLQGNNFLEASEVTGCSNLLIVTNAEQEMLNIEGKVIRVVPAWKWLLGRE